MKKILIIIAAALLTGMMSRGNAQTFTLKSKDIGGQATEQQVFNGFGCKGGNLSPEFKLDKCTGRNKKFCRYHVRP